MTERPFTLEGCSVAFLKPEDAPELQRLYERCSDYVALHEGAPVASTAGEEELAALPPGKTASDKFPLGICFPDGALVGYLDLIRGYPAADAWWLGLLMLDPRVRGQGLGRRICEAAAAWAAAHGAHWMHLAVLENNPAAERFWRRQGFEEIRRQTYPSAIPGQRVIVLRRDLAGAHPGPLPGSLTDDPAGFGRPTPAC